MLSTARAVYSHGDLYDNFVQTFKRVNWAHIPGPDFLLLGYGLGSIPAILEKMGHEFQFTGIEKDAHVIYLASKYTLNDLKSPVHLYEADAGDYLSQQEKTFSAICMDIFVEDQIPSHFTTEKFIQQLKSRLKKNGLLFVNTIRPKDEEEKTLTPFQKQLQQAFPKGSFVEVGPNAVFVNESSALK